jgi:hypothetical protein
MKTMSRLTLLVPGALAVAALTVVVAGSSATPGRAASAVDTAGWDAKAAARYLDQREDWWRSWDRTQKDRGTYCVSCHTQATYAVARPALRAAMGETGPTPQEKAMLASVEKRVGLWTQMQPFYSDIPSGAGKEVESHNSEAVLNAIILEAYDEPSGHLSPLTRMAFDNAWALQSKTGPDAGSWVWQNFGYGPWESKESQYHFAALLAVTVAKAPDAYRSDPKAAAPMAALKTYLQAHYAEQPLINKLAALWALRAFPDLLNAGQKAELIAKVDALQRPDGGWSLSDLAPWERRDKTPLVTKPDGYATAFITLVFEQTGAPGARPVARGRAWLVANQDRTTGAWTAWSVNKDRDLSTDIGKFMSDAATGYAVLALQGR